ncbi:MAG: CYTH domain-containing protein [Caldisericia bacterium]
MSEYEVESKFEIIRNLSKLERIMLRLVESSGYDVLDTVTKNHIDVYLDNKLGLLESGYTLRKRYNGIDFNNITIKSLDSVSEKNNIRIEEKGKTLTELKKKFAKKLKTINQKPEDEEVYRIVSNYENLQPICIVSKERRVIKVGTQKSFCEICIDRFSYLLPMDDGVYLELEIEGSSKFDDLRISIDNKLVSGRWPTLVPNRLSKFERGMKIGGVL